MICHSPDRFALLEEKSAKEKATKQEIERFKD
jgi:hypothetical protein